jgi:hypothetical protein
MPSLGNRPLKVFLCHAHSDAAAVRALHARLIKDGVDAWLDKEKLLPGQDWEFEIRKAVRDADVVIVCLSKQFNQAGFRQKEVRLALETAMEQPEGEIFIIPARLEDCNVPRSLSGYHWVDLFESDGASKLMAALKLRGRQLRRSDRYVSDATGTVEESNLGVGSSAPRISLPDIVVPEQNTFSWYTKRIQSILFSPWTIACGLLGVVIFGFTWSVMNNLLAWPYFLGGPENEPRGFSAFLWGVVAVFPVGLFAHLAAKNHILANWLYWRKSVIAIVLCSIFGGIGAAIFYDSGFREYVIGKNLGYGARELIIVLVWSLLISLFTVLPVLVLFRSFKDIFDMQVFLLQVPFCVIISFLAVVVSLFINVPESQVAMVRGFLAGLGLRGSLFIGFALSIILRLQYRASEPQG